MVLSEAEKQVIREMREAARPKTMTADEFKKLPMGVYRFHWATGGTSVGVLYMTRMGERAVACANWSAGGVIVHTSIHKVDLLATE